MNFQMQNTVFEWTLCAGRSYHDPFNEIELDAVVCDAEGREQRVPAFWAGGDLWKVRFSSATCGCYRLRSICSQVADTGLHGQEVALTVIPYRGDNPLYLHGPLHVAADGRSFVHADGTPFFWLADTWWMGLTKRLSWPQGFQTLALDRLTKGFTTIQIVAGGLYPDMPPFDARGANEAGFPWDEGYTRINPDYFALSERRILYLIENGLLPCLVGCWGYFLPLLGVEKMQQHWRYLIARYAAYPVLFCLAGELDMPYYLAADKDRAVAQQRQGWAELARYCRQIDGFPRLQSIHEGGGDSLSGRELGDGTLVDFHMLQAGHGDRWTLSESIRKVSKAYAVSPASPVILSEVCYEGVGEANRQEVQRMMFWTSLLSGAAGYTYGANGIWQVNSRAELYGASPHGLCWGNTPWEEAYQLPGSAHLGLAKRLLERYPWWRFSPHPEWVDPHWSPENYFGAYAAGIPGEVRVIYFPGSWFTAGKVTSLEADICYHATMINPVNGDELALGPATPDAQGVYTLPFDKGMGNVMPIYQDWLLVLAKATV